LVPERRPAQHADLARACREKSAAAAALADLGPLVLSDHGLDLQQQPTLRRRIELVVQEDDFDSAALQFVDQDHLVGVISAEAVGILKIEPIDGARGCGVAQAFQARPQDGLGGIAVVNEAEFGRDFHAIGLEPCPQEIELTFNRFFVDLLLRGDPGVERGTDGLRRHDEVPPRSPDRH
jgi:hypothetical protein